MGRRSNVKLYFVTAYLDHSIYVFCGTGGVVNTYFIHESNPDEDQLSKIQLGQVFVTEKAPWKDKARVIKIEYDYFYQLVPGSRTITKVEEK